MAKVEQEQELLWDTVKLLAEQKDFDKAEAVLKAAIEKSLHYMDIPASAVADFRFYIPDDKLLTSRKNLEANLRKKDDDPLSVNYYEKIIEYIEMISEFTDQPEKAKKKILAYILLNKSRKRARHKVRRAAFAKSPIPVKLITGKGPEKIFYTTTEAAQTLGFSDQTIRRMCESGKIKGASRSEGGHWRIPVEYFATTREQDRKAENILTHLDKRNKEAGDADEFDL
ncbi:helix-turn-helix domain-containing protein [Evansella sp. LMS18]|uniref:helix-turn-helix domain-containing protein n=1 Tax=Evansella sp. LMS18 TaxID=2924033 RepID=UPI0020D088F4|nr:helix-turn-helix domain-containing protein [Evansella sp. LMS18]UTR10169.1 helix-turn-helix domain-containing protein [Evansella sp. LMS18]